MKTVGQILSIGRNSKNLSISDISIELKISKSIITDLENDNIKNESEGIHLTGLPAIETKKVAEFFGNYLDRSKKKLNYEEIAAFNLLSSIVTISGVLQKSIENN